MTRPARPPAWLLLAALTLLALGAPGQAKPDCPEKGPITGGPNGPSASPPSWPSSSTHPITGRRGGASGSGLPGKTMAGQKYSTVTATGDPRGGGLDRGGGELYRVKSEYPVIPWAGPWPTPPEEPHVDPSDKEGKGSGDGGFDAPRFPGVKCGTGCPPQAVCACGGCT
ncbi:MAG: hypothetical protein ABIP94_01155, partial [Planctomycetota bacterium]